MEAKTEQYIHIKNIEKYNPGYKDRALIWCKAYFTMIHGDPDFELIDNEIDKWRFMALIMLELQLKKPVPNNDKYLLRKGFDIIERPMSLTLQVLHNFIDIVTDPLPNCNADKYKKEVYKQDIEWAGVTLSFEDHIKNILDGYPAEGKIGMDSAIEALKCEITDTAGLDLLKKAVAKYGASKRVQGGFIMDAVKFPGVWKDWANNGHNEDDQGDQRVNCARCQKVRVVSPQKLQEIIDIHGQYLCTDCRGLK